MNLSAHAVAKHVSERVALKMVKVIIQLHFEVQLTYGMVRNE